MIPYAEDSLPLIRKFMHNNDRKHISRFVKGCLKEQNVKAQCPDPIENLWSEVENRVEGKNPTHADKLWQNIQICWKAIS